MFFREKVILINALLLGHVTMATETVSKLTKREKCRMLRVKVVFYLQLTRAQCKAAKPNGF